MKFSVNADSRPQQIHNQLASAALPGGVGSVCILGAATAEAEAAVQRIVCRYAEETGFNPYEFRGTSIGASRFGHLRLIRR